MYIFMQQVIKQFDFLPTLIHFNINFHYSLYLLLWFQDFVLYSWHHLFEICSEISKCNLLCIRYLKPQLLYNIFWIVLHMIKRYCYGTFPISNFFSMIHSLTYIIQTCTFDVKKKDLDLSLSFWLNPLLGVNEPKMLKF